MVELVVAIDQARVRFPVPALLLFAVRISGFTARFFCSGRVGEGPYTWFDPLGVCVFCYGGFLLCFLLAFPFTDAKSKKQNECASLVHAKIIPRHYRGIKDSPARSELHAPPREMKEKRRNHDI